MMCPSTNYISQGFTTLQALVDSGFMSLISGLDIKVPPKNLYSYPHEAFKSVNSMFLMTAPIYINLAFIIIPPMLTGAFVLEKERKIKEGMLMMGLRVSVYW